VVKLCAMSPSADEPATLVICGPTAARKIGGGPHDSGFGRNMGVISVWL
jgi:hypothetical protein